MSTTKRKADTRVKRSEKLPPALMKDFVKRIGEFDTMIDAAEFFGFSTVTLYNIQFRGSAKPSTIETIRVRLKVA